MRVSAKSDYGVRAAGSVVGLRFSWSVAALALFAACATVPVEVEGWRGAEPRDLAGRAFHSDFAPRDAAAPRVPGTQVRLSFHQGVRVFAHAGCNNIIAPYVVNGGRLSTAELEMGIMGCAPNRLTQDEWLASVLASSGPEIFVRGAELRIVASAGLLGGSQELMLTDAVQAAVEPLVGSGWRLATIDSGGLPADPTTQPAPVLVEFDDQGKARWDLGCAPGGSSTLTYGGAMDYGRNPDGSVWMLMLPVAARPLCGGPIEQAVFEALFEADSRLVVEGERIVLDADSNRLVFERLP